MIASPFREEHQSQLEQNYRDRWLTAVEMECFDYGLDPKVIDALIEIESGWNPWAIRYENRWTYFTKAEAHAKLLRISLESEKMAQKISWGFGQIMGGTARHMGFTGHLSSLCDPVTNIQIICKMINKIGESYPDIYTQIAVYNGGARAAIKTPEGEFKNKEHVDRFKKAYQRLVDQSF